MADVLRNRPMLLLAIGFILGLSLREYAWNSLLILPLLLLIRVPGRCLAIALGLAAGMILSPSLPHSGIQDREFVQGRARIVTVPRLYPQAIAYEIEIQGQRLTLTESRSSDRSYGDHLQVEGLARPLREGSEEYMLAKGIVGRFRPSHIQRLSEGPAWHRAALALRQSFVEFTKRSLPPEKAAILDALCFNVEGGLSDDFENSLRTTGTIHIISASGLHVLLLAVAIDGLLGLLPIPRPIRLLILGLLLAFYASAAGLQPAIIRSILMSMVALTAYMWRRESDLLSGLSLAAIAYLLWDPRGIFNIGFQISFATVGAFALFGHIADSFPKTALGAIKNQSLEALRTSFIAFVATLPIVAFYFGFFSIVSIPANIVILPAVMVLVVGGLAAFAVSVILPAAGLAIAEWVLGPLASFVEWVLTLFGSFGQATIPSSYFSGYWLLAVYVVLGWWVRERVRPA